ncbi:uncharacterized protein BXZ73DRAFT_77369 [Epithele typhae]|uniref:uncharacterized protein n=1 Tax=Epithele typhae TaxID=378194 RepID=UPI002007EABD|nr:uncharacterized protein BXZ73DRAFT_77369 [Epithele typhae]KAH9933210.1 hypothetical protein BXZ73DRAFT_77369 [Epithele typhae]
MSMSDSAGCRILAVSPSAARAHQFVQRVQALSAALARTGSFGDGKGKETEAEADAAPTGREQTSVSTSPDPLAAGSSTSIPWTIANRYYTAEVHFETHDVDRFRALHAVGVPAVIYVWGASEPYREHIPAIANKIRAYDPEVALAVRFGVGDAADPPPGTNEDEDGLDEFMSEHGFEFVEGERAWRRPTQDEDRHSDDEDSGIPGLPRVIDALSTIMWPSLVQSAATRQRKSRARDLIGWALEEEADDGLRALIPDVPRAPPGVGPDLDEAVAAGAAGAAKRKSRMQREMEELERWLEDEEAGAGRKFGRDEKAKAQENEHEEQQQRKEAAADEEARTWVATAPVSAADGWEDMLAPPSAAHTPRDATFPDIHLPAPSPRVGSDDGSDAETEHGFDDDFADFVAAGPYILPTHDADRLLEVRYDVGRLTPMHTGASYRSLGSVSDFGGNDSMSATSGAYGVLGDDDDSDDDALNEGGDPDLPSRAEIFETSRRLFGAGAFAPAPDDPTPLASTSAPAARAPEPRSPTAADADAAADLSLDTDDGEESFAALDLSRVFSVLQGMKDEIAGMDDEDERRRAAARVALGLVYGLGGPGTGGRAGSTTGVAGEEAGAA